MPDEDKQKLKEMEKAIVTQEKWHCKILIFGVYSIKHGVYKFNIW